jgi:hypothetical protein
MEIARSGIDCLLSTAARNGATREMTRRATIYLEKYHFHAKLLCLRGSVSSTNLMSNILEFTKDNIIIVIIIRVHIHYTIHWYHLCVAVQYAHTVSIPFGQWMYSTTQLTHESDDHINNVCNA